MKHKRRISPFARTAAALALLLVALPAHPQGEASLVPRQRLEVSMGDRQVARYRLHLDQDQLLSLEIEQIGVDVGVTLEGPGGNKLVDTDGLLGAAGIERIVWWVEKTGSYDVEIRVLERSARSGRVKIWLGEPKAANETGRLRASAAKTYYEAKRLHDAGRARPAAQKYLEALDRWGRLGDTAWIANVYNSLAALYYEEGDVEATLKYCNLALSFAGDNAAMQATAHFMSGYIFMGLHDVEAARKRYERAFELWQATDDKRRLAVAASSIGLTYRRLGELQNALSYYRAALEVWQDPEIWQDREILVQKVIVSNNIGKVYISLGRTDQALTVFREALDIAQDIEYQDGIGLALNGMGQAFEKAGDLEEALRYLERSLKYREPGRRGRAVTLAWIGQVNYRKGDKTRARKLYESSLEIFRDNGDVRGEASVLLKISLLSDASEPDRALNIYSQALDTFRRTGDPEGEVSALLGLARARRFRGDLKMAQERAAEALGMIEELRDYSGDIELRSSYFASKQSYYDFYVDLLMELAERYPESGYEAEALSASERSRERSLLEALFEGGIEIRRGVEPRLLEREENLHRLQKAKYYQLERLLSGKSIAPEEVARARESIRVGSQQLSAIRNEIRTKNPFYAALKYPQPLRADEIQRRVLDQDTLLLEYQLGESRSFVWAVTSDALRGFTLPAKAEIEKIARRASNLLNVSHNGQHRVQSEWALQEASKVLLGPVAAFLNKKRILVVAEGDLQYLPFAALPAPAAADGAEPLVARHEVVGLPSVSIIPVLRQRLRDWDGAPQGVAVLADPVFRRDDPRIATPPAVATSVAPAADERDLPERLYYTLQEAESILGLAGERRKLKAVGFDARKETAVSSELKEYRYIHIATHGHINARFPELSSLVFSLFDSGGRRQQGRLRAHEIYNLDLQADLVALSACQTGRSEAARGEGLAGWTQGFMYSGARRVLVSLWNIDDEATSELMRRFYAGLLEEKLSPAAALREAQNYIRSQPRWQTPYYWAAFVLQGEFL